MMMISLIMCANVVLLFVPMRCHVIAEFDVSTEENLLFGDAVHRAGNLAKTLGENIETKLGRSYEFLGHSMCRLCSFKTNMSLRKKTHS